jgi:hypothetical protein
VECTDDLCNATCRWGLLIVVTALAGAGCCGPIACGNKKKKSKGGGKAPHGGEKPKIKVREFICCCCFRYRSATAEYDDVAAAAAAVLAANGNGVQRVENREVTETSGLIEIF